MNYELLNKIISYLEENLTNDIDTKKLAKKLGLNDFIMGRVFSIVTGITIAEYVRKRRLSLAFEELKLTDNKIIDVALKHGYDSSVSFARSFKKEFGITPSKVSKDKGSTYKLFPRMNFNSKYLKKDIIKYEIKNVSGLTIYGRKITAKTYDDLHYKIRKLYKEIKKDGTYDLFNKYERYAKAYSTSKDNHYYIIGCKKKINNLDKYEIVAGKYAIFEVGSLKQKDILETESFINEIYYNSLSMLSILNNPYIEQYKDNNCFIWVPLEKRNKTDM